jgi:integrase
MYANQKLILDKRRPKKSGLYPLKVRVTFLKTQKYYPVGIDLTELDFDRINNSSTRKEFITAKKKILSLQSRIQKIIDSLEVFSFFELQKELVKDFDNPSKKKGVYDFFEKVIIELNAEGRVGTANVYRDAHHSLKSFRSSLAFPQLTVDLLKEYESKMKSEGKSITTIGIYLRHLRAIYNKAIEAGIVDQKSYPFGKNRFQIKAPRNIKKALTIDQIKKIMDYEVENDSTQHFVRDIWLFSYLCNGMNIKDILNLKFTNIQGDFIHYDRAKTSNTIQNPKPIIISLLPKAKEILKKWSSKDRNDKNYVFPIFHKNLDEKRKQQIKHQFIKTINKYMKMIGEEIGYDKPLTTYVARHSFATVLKRSGAPMELISESLGHKSLHTTEAYLDSFEDQTRRKFMENLMPK